MTFPAAYAATHKDLNARVFSDVGGHQKAALSWIVCGFGWLRTMLWGDWEDPCGYAKEGFLKTGHRAGHNWFL